MTDGPGLTLSACYAKNRPSGSTVVYLVLPDAARSLCGVHRGQAADPGTVTCRSCQETAEPTWSPGGR